MGSLTCSNVGEQIVFLNGNLYISLINTNLEISFLTISALIPSHEVLLQQIFRSNLSDFKYFFFINL